MTPCYHHENRNALQKGKWVKIGLAYYLEEITHPKLWISARFFGRHINNTERMAGEAISDRVSFQIQWFLNGGYNLNDV